MPSKMAISHELELKNLREHLHNGSLTHKGMGRLAHLRKTEHAKRLMSALTSEHSKSESK